MKLPKTRNVLLVVAGVLLLIGAALFIAEDQEMLRVRTAVAASDPRFPQYLARLLGHPLTSGDKYTVHTNGNAVFPAMLTAIGSAKSRISFESYIFVESQIAEQFVSAFEAAARRGVEVRLVLDALGSQSIDPEHLERLEHAGCQIGWFHPVGRFSIEDVNYRTHRKALVIDGDLAFVGGVGVADHWAVDTEDGKRWRDTHFEVRGSAAIDIEAAFNENWIETGGIVAPDVLIHDNEPDGSARSVVVWSSPEGGTNSMKLLYLLTIAAARRTIDIQSPYLITDETTRWSISEARRRGVRVRMLVEGDITDAKPVKFAGRAGYQGMMEEGVEIFEYQPAMMHTKALVVDGAMAIVGSANFDNRSFELNDELNVVVFETAVAARLLEDFERDLMQSRKLELAAWRERPVHIRWREKVWSLFGEVF